jgi:hypothetical protein
MEIKFIKKDGNEAFRENADGTTTFFDESLKKEMEKKSEEQDREPRTDA